MDSIRKIIHIDADCFYASVEMRDNPALRDVPLVVGGLAERRGVVATCNYVAREYGVHSAMPTATALRLCPQLVVVPPRMDLYREVSLKIRAIFATYTALIEPLSLDEAFLDVTHSPNCHGSATLIAEDIRRRVEQELGITVSAGVAPNKFLAKIASDWNKPNGLKVIVPAEVEEFVRHLPVKKLHGVGKATAEKLAALGIHNCADVRHSNEALLIQRLGKFGRRLWQLAHGIDNRPVEPDRRRKSVSVERTFNQDLPNLATCLAQLPMLLEKLAERLERLDDSYELDRPFVKVKFHDFSQTTLEQVGLEASLESYQTLLTQAHARGNKAVRLLGVGVQLHDKMLAQEDGQLKLF